MRSLSAQLLAGRALYDEVVQRRLLRAKRTAWISTANVKAMMVEDGGTFVPVVDALARLAHAGVETRILHADRPSRPFREALERQRRALGGRLEMRVCPRVHVKLVIVDGTWVYMGSANLTGAGLGAKDELRRNFELGIGTEDAEVLDHATALFEAIWSGAECGPCRRRDVCPAPLGPETARPRTRRPSRTSGVVLGRTRRFPRP